MRHYLRARFYRDNIPKYYKYFDSWFDNLTENQLYYFEKDLKGVSL